MSVRAGWPDERPSISAKFDSTCPSCEDDICEGDTIHWDDELDAYVCDYCGGD